MDRTHLELLQGMAIFGGVREDILEYILSLSRTLTVKKGEFAFRENDPGHSFYVVEAGRVAIMKSWNNEQHLLMHCEKGDCFGEMAIMDFMPRSASAVAVEDSTIIEVPTACLYQLHKKDLEQFALIQMNMGREVSRRLRQADERLFHLGMERGGLPK